MMDKCHVLKELSSYLDNQLTGARKQKVEEHLLACSVCSQELARLRTLSERLKAWQVPNLDAGFDNSVRNEIVRWELERRQVKMKKSTLAILIPSSAIAGILVVLFLGNTLLHMGVQGRLRQASDHIGEQFSTGEAPSAGYRVEREGIPSPYYTEQKLLAAKIGSASGFEASGRKTSYAYQGSRGSDVALGSATNQVYPPTKAEMPSGEGSVIIIQPVLPATGEGEKIIRAAQVRLEVEDGRQAYQKASAICQELGGYLAASNFLKDEEGRESGTIAMRIPKDKFLIALDKVGALGKVDNVNTTSEDVSQQYANLKARLDAAMVVYNKMVEALQKRQATIPEAIKLESELTPILTRIENLKNNLESLNNAVSFTTITVHFYEPGVSVKILKESTRYIKEGILSAQINAIRFLARALPVVTVAAIWLGLVLLFALLLTYGIMRLFRRK